MRMIPDHLCIGSEVERWQVSEGTAEPCSPRQRTKPSFRYRFTVMVVFGSYLSVKSKMGDVDLAIHLEPKPEFRDGWAERVLAHAAEAEARGRRFSRFADRLGWAEQETRMFLKAGSRSLSLHD